MRISYHVMREFRRGFRDGKYAAWAEVSSSAHRGPTRTSIYDRAFMAGYRQEQRKERWR